MLHNPRDRPLFKPIPGVNGSQIFKDIVFGFVALGDIDKVVKESVKYIASCSSHSVIWSEILEAQ